VSGLFVKHLQVRGITPSSSGEAIPISSYETKAKGVTSTDYWFGFGVSFDTQYVLFVLSRYRLILDMFYVTFQDYHF